ncbi:avidin-like [Chanodichthys erythropterus]|uniref:avidin-like n=1 Tax=Chanodichthys erythropterus TaxID=933992 RepID=UPI00351DEBE2
MEKAGSSAVSGKWENELGSVMELMVKDSGQITGKYTTAVTTEDSSQKEKTTELVGYINTDQTKQTTTIAFCMAWKIKGSCSAFSGQIFKEDNGTDVMKTTWLLHSPAESLGENWDATCIGENTFHRCP